MPRVVSFIVLLGILLLIGTLFFKVMVQFVVPLFLAAVLVVIFKPLQQWFLEKLPERPRIASLATTVAIVAIVILPAVFLGWQAYVESRDKVVSFLEDKERTSELVAAIDDRESKLLGWYEKTFGAPLDVKGLVETAGAEASGWVVSGLKAVLGTLVGLAIMTFALYYFLADGPAMIEALMRLSPLDDDYERELLAKFSNISRSVVVASLLSAIAQGLLAGGGYYFALSDEAPIALLTMMTMMLALVPFIGGAAIWIPVVAWVYLVNGRTGAAIGLAAYCALVVSMVDNLIKPYVLHGQSNLHPLLALLSVLGGVQVLGPIGIIVGPMLVAFLQALLNMVHKELHRLAAPDDAPPQEGQKPVSKVVQREAEAAARGTKGLHWPGGFDSDEPSGAADDQAGEPGDVSPPPPATDPPKGAAKSPSQSKRRGKRNR